MDSLPEKISAFAESVACRPSTKSVQEFIKKNYDGFDLEQVFTRLEAFSLDKQFEWTEISAEISSSGNLIVRHEYDNLDFSDRPLLLTVILNVAVDGSKVVELKEMFLPRNLQRQGLSAELLKPYYEQVRNAGVDFIRIEASDAGGGYAWAKYGFEAVNQSDLHSILERAETSTIEKPDIADLRTSLVKFYKNRPDTIPFPIRTWTSFPFSEELLTGTTWRGILNLKDDDVRNTFEEYLYNRP